MTISDRRSDYEYHSGDYEETDTYIPETVAVRASYSRDYYMTEVADYAVAPREAAFDRWFDSVMEDDLREQAADVLMHLNNPSLTLAERINEVHRMFNDVRRIEEADD